jgi:hypothetical protein
VKSPVKTSQNLINIMGGQFLRGINHLQNKTASPATGLVCDYERFYESFARFSDPFTRFAIFQGTT